MKKKIYKIWSSECSFTGTSLANNVLWCFCSCTADSSSTQTRIGIFILNSLCIAYLVHPTWLVSIGGRSPDTVIGSQVGCCTEPTRWSNSSLTMRWWLQLLNISLCATTRDIGLHDKSLLKFAGITLEMQHSVINIRRETNNVTDKLAKQARQANHSKSLSVILWYTSALSM